MLLDEEFLKTHKKKKLKIILQLQSMCYTILKHTEIDNMLMTEDKVSRWLGFIQGIMTINGWITVEQERETTRPLFHQAYKEQGVKKPISIKAELKPIFLSKEYFITQDLINFSSLKRKKKRKIILKTFKDFNTDLIDRLSKLDFDVLENDEMLEIQVIGLR